MSAAALKLQREFATVASRHGWRVYSGRLFIRNNPGSDVEWTLQWSLSQAFGVLSIWFHCGVRPLAEAPTLKVLYRLLPTIRPLIESQFYTIISVSSDRWVQGAHYVTARQERYVQEPNEDDAEFLERALEDITLRASPVWAKYRSAIEVYQLLLLADDPFPRWVGGNGLACALLMVILGIQCDRPEEEYRAALADRWRSVERDAFGLGLDPQSIIRLAREALESDSS